jgi:hypothetical protein
MDKNMKRLVAVALLMALFLFGVLFTGTSQAQSGQPYAPGPGWHHDMMGQGMMGGMMGRHMGLWLRDAGWRSGNRYGDLW